MRKTHSLVRKVFRLAKVFDFEVRRGDRVIRWSIAASPIPMMIRARAQLRATRSVPLPASSSPCVQSCNT
jgi:hypothetical protein